VRNIPLENLVFWLSAPQESADERNSAVVLKKTLPLRGKPDVLTTSWIDVGTLLNKPFSGVVELEIATQGATAKSRIMLTDLNLIAKQSATSGKVNVWALTMHTDAPVAGVEVKQVTMSGRVISRCTTDRSGGCILDGRDPNDPDPSDPFALIASREG